MTPWNSGQVQVQTPRSSRMVNPKVKVKPPGNSHLWHELHTSDMNFDTYNMYFHTYNMHFHTYNIYFHTSKFTFLGT